MYPISLDLTGRRVLVVGGGAVNARRVEGLLEAGARVEVVAPQVSDPIRALEARGALIWHRRGFERPDLVAPSRAWLVHTATASPLDAEIAALCEGEGIWCVRTGAARESAAWTPAVARGRDGTTAEGVVVAVSGDADPRRAVAVRDAVMAGLESGTLPVRRVRAVPGEPDEPGEPGEPDEPGEPGEPARVALVGGGPGAVDLITVRGRQLLAAADVVVADRLGPRALLAELGDDVEIIDVGKTAGHHTMTQERINEVLVEQARLGRTVVRLKGGDPYVLGRGGEEAIFCAEHGVAVEVVPGITSAVSVPAAAGIPVTHRGLTMSFVVASAHAGADAAVQALTDAPRDATLVLLMGVSAIGDTAAQLIASGRRADTPTAFVESGWTPQQRVTVTTLERAAATAEAEGVRAPAVIVVGDVVALTSRLPHAR